MQADRPACKEGENLFFDELFHFGLIPERNEILISELDDLVLGYQFNDNIVICRHAVQTKNTAYHLLTRSDIFNHLFDERGRSEMPGPYKNLSLLGKLNAKLQELLTQPSEEKTREYAIEFDESMTKTYTTIYDLKKRTNRIAEMQEADSKAELRKNAALKLATAGGVLAQQGSSSPVSMNFVLQTLGSIQQAFGQGLDTLTDDNGCDILIKHHIYDEMLDNEWIVKAMDTKQKVLQVAEGYLASTGITHDLDDVSEFLAFLSLLYEKLRLITRLSPHYHAFATEREKRYAIHPLLTDINSTAFRELRAMDAEKEARTFLPPKLKAHTATAGALSYALQQFFKKYGKIKANIVEALSALMKEVVMDLSDACAKGADETNKTLAIFQHTLAAAKYNEAREACAQIASKLNENKKLLIEYLKLKKTLLDQISLTEQTINDIDNKACRVALLQEFKTLKEAFSTLSFADRQKKMNNLSIRVNMIQVALTLRKKILNELTVNNAQQLSTIETSLKKLLDKNIKSADFKKIKEDFGKMAGTVEKEKK